MMDAATIADRALRRALGGRLRALPVDVRFWDGSVLAASASTTAAAPGAAASDAATGAPRPTVVVSRRALAHLLRAPDQLGLARAWVDGSLTVEGDLEAVLAARHRAPAASPGVRDRARLALAAVRAGGPRVLVPPPIPASEARVHGHRHSLARDRAAVTHHYDVSNDFYRLVLGPSLVYSCAYFADPSDALERAQERKLDLICRKLALAPGQRLLDIGCGWGSLVLHAAAHYGVQAVGVTLSQPQARLARERAAEAGLADRVRIEVADYRELRDDTFDRIASVGMFEHVGLGQMPAYMQRAHALLRPGGLMLNHGIGRLAAHAPRPDPFIARYVFPDGELLPIADVLATMQASGLEVRDVESLREHYPLTLRRWVANLRARREAATAIVGPERVRVWELYMLGSALGFEDAQITVYQVLAARHGAPHGLPLDRTRLLAPRPARAQEPSSGNDRRARAGTT